MKNYEIKTLALYFLAVSVNLIFLVKYFPVIASQSEVIYNYIQNYIASNPSIKDISGFTALNTIIDILLGTPLLLTSICISQSVMLIIAIKGFYNLSSSVISNKYFIYFTMIIFATHPSLGVAGENIITDSFAMAGLIFFIVNLRKIIIKPEKRRLFPLIFNMFFLSFLRSTLIFLIPVGFFTSLYMYLRSKNKIYISSLIGSLFILSLHIGVYFVKKDCFEIKDNRTKIEIIEDEFTSFPNRILESANTNLSYSGMKEVSVFEGVIFRDYYKIPMKIIYVYLMMILYLGYIIYKYLHYRKYNKTEILLWSFVALNIILMITGKTTQYNRMIMPVVPLILILASNMIYISINKARNIIGNLQ